MTFEQIAQILETPLGNYDQYSDVVVVRERKRIVQMYSELKDKKGYSQASLQARVQWMFGAQQLGEFPC
jgi:hypothetical protein